jgi:hypothetical protein
MVNISKQHAEIIHGINNMVNDCKVLRKLVNTNDPLCHREILAVGAAGTQPDWSSASASNTVRGAGFFGQIVN